MHVEIHQVGRLVFDLLPKVSCSGFHKELGLFLSRLGQVTCPNLGPAMRFFISPRTSPKLGLALTICEIDSCAFKPE